MSWVTLSRKFICSDCKMFSFYCEHFVSNCDFMETTVVFFINQQQINISCQSTSIKESGALFLKFRIVVKLLTSAAVNTIHSNACKFIWNISFTNIKKLVVLNWCLNHFVEFYWICLFSKSFEARENTCIPLNVW